MAYFSRLTDIVTCNLTAILNAADDPAATIEQIIREMEEGRSGAQRSVSTAQANEERLAGEIAEQRSNSESWTTRAKEQLRSGNEDQARLSLVRKQECDALLAGLEQQHEAAAATREHMQTTLRALEARLTDARRRQQQIAAGGTGDIDDGAATTAVSDEGVTDSRSASVDAELEALKKELGQ